MVAQCDDLYLLLSVIFVWLTWKARLTSLNPKLYQRHAAYIFSQDRKMLKIFFPNG